MKVLISQKTGIYYYHDKIEQDYHCKEGVIKKEDIMDGTNFCKSNLGREFLVVEGSNFDKVNKFKRGPQLIQAKDLGYVVGRTRINKTSKILEAGGGMGAATSFFASIVDKITTYEIREEHLKIIQKNLDYMNIENVELKLGDLNETIQDEKDIDMLFLDMPSCEKVLEKDLSGIKNGAYIVCYIPNITQILELTEVVKQNSNTLYLEEVTEIISRQWKVWDKVARPMHRKETDHTAFLVFIRKV